MTGIVELGSPDGGEPGLRKWTTDALNKVKTWSRGLNAGTLEFKATADLPYKNVQEAIEAQDTAKLSVSAVSAFVLTILNDANAAAVLATLGIVVDTYPPAMSFAVAGTSSFTYTDQSGFYLKLGSFYIFFANMTVTPTIGTGSGNLRFSLPATAHATIPGTGWVTRSPAQLAWTAGRTMLSFLPTNNVAFGTILALGTAVAPNTLTVAELTGGVAQTYRYGGVFST